MAHVVTTPRPPFSSQSGSLEVHQVPAAEDNLVWVVGHRETREAFAVDGPDAQGALELCKAQGYRLTTVFNTHTHGDHIGLNMDLQARGLLDSMRVIGAAQSSGAVPGLTEPVEDGSEIQLLGAPGKILLTEGHVNGHISLLLDGLLFCGDTLFAGGCGYLFDGPPQTMFESLQKLAALPGGTQVCCAHEYTQDNLRFAYSVDPGNGALRSRIKDVWRLRAAGGCAVPSTIDDELATNPFLRSDTEALRHSVASAMPGRSLETPGLVFAATRALKDRGDHRNLSDAELPL